MLQLRRFAAVPSQVCDAWRKKSCYHYKSTSCTLRLQGICCVQNTCASCSHVFFKFLITHYAQRQIDWLWLDVSRGYQSQLLCFANSGKKRVRITWRKKTYTEVNNTSKLIELWISWLNCKLKANQRINNDGFNMIYGICLAFLFFFCLDWLLNYLSKWNRNCW